MVDKILEEGAQRLAEAITKELNNSLDKNLPLNLVETIKAHSFGAAAAAVASGWFPGVGGAAMVATSAGFIWTMYAKIGNEIGFKFSEHIIKSLATGIASNLIALGAGGAIATSVISFIPIGGWIAASLIAGSTAYSLTIIAGYIYLKILTNIFESQINPNSLSQEDLKDMADNIIKKENIKDMMEKAKTDYKNSK